MKRFILAAVFLLSCVVSPASMKASSHKQPTVDMSNRKRVFVGWVDMKPDAFAFLGYDTKAEWVGVIDNLNAYFLQELQSEYLPGRTITAAKNKDDENAADSDLYIKFSDVSVDHEYRLHLAIHFIDPKNNAEIATIPSDRYTGRVCGLVGCLEKSLRKVGERLDKEMSAPDIKK